MKFNKSFLVKIFIVSLMLLSLFNPVTQQTNAATQNQYSGEELYRGIIFGQGEFGKEVITDTVEYEKMNSAESIEFVDKYIAYIKEKDPLYFKKLETTLYSKNATRSLAMLQNSGKQFDAFLEQFEVPEPEVSPSCSIAACGVVVVVVGYSYVVVVQAVAAVQVGYAAWALKTKAVNNLKSGEVYDDEKELAKILNIL